MRVELECGCVSDITHEQGDRIFVCVHGRHWVIESNHRICVTYIVRETKYRRVA